MNMKDSSMRPDTGFRVLKITDSAFEPINETQTRIRDFCSEEAAFFEVMTTAGIDLGAPVHQIMLTCGKRIWQAGNTDAMTGLQHAPGQAASDTTANGKTPTDTPRPDLLLIACFERTLTDINPRTLALDIARIAVPGQTLFAFMDAAFGSPQEQAQGAPKQCLLDYLKRNDVAEIIPL